MAKKQYLNSVDDISLLQSSSGALTVSGTNTYTAGTTPALTAYVSGQPFLCTFTNANTGACTLNIDTVGAKAIKRNGSTTLKEGDILSGQTFWLSYNGTDFMLVGRVTTDWFPTAVTLGDWFANGATASLSSGAGAYFSFSGSTDDEIVVNVGLTRNGVAYDGSDIQIEINWQKFGASGGTVVWELDYYFANDGSDSYTGSDGTVTKTVDVTALGNQIQTTDLLPVISGSAGSTQLQLTLRVNATGEGQGTYTGDAELYGANLVK